MTRLLHNRTTKRARTGRLLDIREWPRTHHADRVGTSGRPLYFLHIPKTAGSTLSRYLEAGFRADEVCPASTWDALLKLSPDKLGTYRLFRGHFGAMLHDVLPRRPDVITFLRDPVEQAVSAWLYLQRHPTNPQHAEVMRQGPDFAAYVRARPANPQARYLGIDVAPPELLRRRSFRGYSRGHEAHELFVRATEGQPDLLARAVGRLHECLAFGIVDRFNDSLELVADSLGWAPPGGFASVNVKPAEQAAYRPTEEEIEVLRTRDGIDFALVDRARELFEARRAAMMRRHPRLRYERRLSALAAPLREVLTVDLGEPFGGTGWLPPLRVLSGWVRWMGPAGHASIDIPALLPPRTRIDVLCVAVMSRGLIESWTLEVNGTPVSLSRTPWDTGVLYSGVVDGSPDERAGFTRLVIRVPETVRCGLGTNGVLDLGIAVSWVILRPPSASAGDPPPPGTPNRLEDAEAKIVAAGVTRAARPARPLRFRVEARG